MMHDKHRSQPAVEPFVRRHRNVFVGLFILIPIFAVPVLVIFTVVKSDLLQNWCTLYAVCDNSEGLKKGNQVSMSGTTIGHVSDVNLVREGEVHVSFSISSKYKHLVKSDTKASLKQRGFVGDWEIELHGGSARASDANDGDTLRFEKISGLDGLITTAMGIIDTATALLNDVAAIVNAIKEGEGTIGQLFSNDSLYRNINKTAVSALAVASNVGSLSNEVRKTVRNTDSLISTTTALSKGGAVFIDTLSALINTANGTINQINEILKNAKTVSDEAPEVMTRLQRDLDEAEYMIKSFKESWLFKQMSNQKPKNPHLAETP